MATPPLLLRNYRRSLLARGADLAVRHAPTVGSFLRRAGARARTAAFQVGGLGMIVWGAWQVAAPLGAVVGGLALLLLEPLTAPDEGQ